MKKIFMFLMLLAGLAAFNESKAQCTFTVTNNGVCTVEIITVYNNGSTLIYNSTMVAGSSSAVFNFNPCVGVLKFNITDQGNFQGGTINTIGSSIVYNDCDGNVMTATWQTNGDVDIL